MTEVEKAKKFSEVSKKVDHAKRDVEIYCGFLESDIRFNRDTTRNTNALESAAKRLKSLEEERDRLK